MSQRKAVIDNADAANEQSENLRRATERAEIAEAKLAEMKARDSSADAPADKRRAAPAAADTSSAEGGDKEKRTPESFESGGVDELRKDSMMSHLLDSLEAGKDIGHYGRLVFAMVARHFLAHDEVLRYLTLDKDFSEEQALLMLHQVEGRDYNPPRRERILEWQREQDFPILPNPDDPDCGNLYRNLKFPDEVYEHIGHYQEEKIQAAE